MEEIRFEYDLGLFGDTMNRVIMKNYPHRTKDFVESFISNQVNCKIWLVEELKKVLIRNDKFDPWRMTILGSWYGNVIVPLVHDNLPRIKEIDLIDMDVDALNIGRKFLNEKYKRLKINYTCEDINFYEFDDMTTKIVVNTSCEHMFDMSSITFKNDDNVIWVLQSNNMRNIREHVNCVDSSEELADQCGIQNIMYQGKMELIGSNGEPYERYMVMGRR